MITFLKILFLIALSAATISCGNDNPNDPGTPPPSDANFKYPTGVNSFWYYGSRNFLRNIRPDSVRRYFNDDTLTGIGAATFVRDTVINGEPVIQLRNEHSSAGHAHTTIEYYRQTDTGLVRKAFFTNGSNFGPYRPVGENLSFSVNGFKYSSIEELLNSYRNNLYTDNGDTNVIIIENPPPTAIRYPITKNSEWNFVNSGTTRITKKYLDFENVTVPAGTFHCIKIQRSWYYNSSTPDQNTFSYDYFSKEGMIKRDFMIRNVLVSNSTGAAIGYIDILEEDFLNLFSLP